MLNVRQHIDLYNKVQRKNPDIGVIVNLELCHDHGETVSSMMKLLTPKERKIVRKNFYINVKKNKIRRK